MDFSLEINVDSFLLVNVSFFDFDFESLLCKFFLVDNFGGISFLDLVEVFNHISEDANLLLNDRLVLGYQFSVHSLKINQLLVRYLLQHLGLDLFLLSGELDDLSVLLPYLHHVALDLLVDAGIRCLFHGVVKLLHLLNKLVLPRQGCVVHQVGQLGLQGVGFVLLAFQDLFVALLDQANTEIILRLELINPLF